MMSLLDKHLGVTALPPAETGMVEDILREAESWKPALHIDILVLLRACRNVFLAASGQAAKDKTAAQIFGDAEHSLRLVAEALTCVMCSVCGPEIIIWEFDMAFVDALNQ